MALRRPIASVSRTQALNSNTFTPPPLDGSLSFPEIIDFHFEHSPDHPLYTYVEDGSVKTLKWRDVAPAVYMGAKILRERFQPDVQPQKAPIVVGILAFADAISYSLVEMAVMRANYTVFPLSPRNSPAALAHLIDKGSVQYIIVGREQQWVDLCAESLKVLCADHPQAPVPGTMPMPTFEELLSGQEWAGAPPADMPYEYPGPDAAAMIMHSSGSTAFPKPIIWTHEHLIHMASTVWFDDHDLCGAVVTLHLVPMFHTLGFNQLLWAVSCGFIIASVKPGGTFPVPSPDDLFSAIRATKTDVVLAMPSVVEVWSRNAEYVEWLAGRRAVVYSGGPLNKECGDSMVAQGVQLRNFYGSTEVGAISDFCNVNGIHDWEYFRLSKHIERELVPNGPNTVELILISRNHCSPMVLNTEVQGVKAYATSDLLMAHPTMPGYWKIFGRADDQIVHSNGMNTNPGPLENILNQDPHILSCVLFGSGRIQVGAIVDPKPQYQFDVEDPAQLERFRDMIWPTVERLNAIAPQPSRLYREMIIAAKPAKPFTYTAKNTVRRTVVIAAYHEEIDALYKAAEENMQEGSVMNRVFLVPSQLASKG